MWPSHRGLAEKPILLKNGEFRAETTRCLKCDHLPHDGSVRLDFMTDDVNEAEEMRFQTVASGAWPKSRILMNPVGAPWMVRVPPRLQSLEGARKRFFPKESVAKAYVERLAKQLGDYHSQALGMTSTS
jgi:hypothetical protein